MVYDIYYYKYGLVPSHSHPLILDSCWKFGCRWYEEVLNLNMVLNIVGCTLDDWEWSRLQVGGGV